MTVKNQKQIKIVSLLIVMVVFMTSCVQGANTSGKQPEAGSFMKVEHTDQFSVQYLEKGAKLVTDAEDRKLLLVPRGQEAPSGYDDAIVIATPVQRAMCSTTQIGMLRPYDVWDHIGGITSAINPASQLDKDIKASGADVVYLGGGMGEPDYEKVQALNPDIAFVYTGRSAQTALIAKLEELGIPYAVDNEYMESDYKGRMEWTKFLAVFFNKDAQALEYADSQLKLLSDMDAKVANAPKPKVAWGNIYNGVVYVPGSESFVAKQLSAAGCEYVFADRVPGAGNGQISLEEFYSGLLEADILICPYNNYANYDALIQLAPIFSNAPSIVNKKVWQFNPDYYYYTDQTAQQVVELAAIFHPDLYPGYKHFHYVPLTD